MPAEEMMAMAAAPASATTATPKAGRLLRLKDLQVTYDPTGRGSVPLVRDASFEIRTGEIVCLVGESGSGKSVTAKAIMGLIQNERGIDVTGSIEFDGRELVDAPGQEIRALRGRDLAMVFQEPMSSLDPVFTIASQLTEAVERVGVHGGAVRPRMVELLRHVGIHDPDRVLRSYPHQMSGGMCQRVMIAMALAAEPKLLIADEPTTALDVTIQAQILDLIDTLRRDAGMAVLLVTHDMGVAAEVADRVVVMYAGRVVEDGDPRKIFTGAHHPYTVGLLECIPPIAGQRPDVLPAIPGAVPDPRKLPSGCAFHPRCPYALDKCSESDPALVPFGSGRVACWNPRNEEVV
jgi:oligopeptide/dipeptide ABC transporter ATP-binding protein